MCDILSNYGLPFLKSLMKFVSASFQYLQRNDLTSDPDCGLDLECGNLTLVCNTPSYYVLSFGKVSLNLPE